MSVYMHVQDLFEIKTMKVNFKYFSPIQAVFVLLVVITMFIGEGSTQKLTKEGIFLFIHLTLRINSWNPMLCVSDADASTPA